MTEEYIDYSKLIDNALRGVVVDLLKQCLKSGLPGDHHFYITFRTDAPGVFISEALRQRYPEEMTIVLQYQFWELKVEDVRFSVMLSFNKVKERLTVPYSAITSFVDPSVKFGLQFQSAEDMDDMDMEDLLEQIENEISDSDNVKKKTPPSEGTAKIITLDSFRKK